MLYKIRISLLIIFLSISLSTLKAQNADLQNSRKQTWPVSISLSSHSWSLPFTNLGRLKPFYPGFSLGSEFYYIKKQRGQLFQTIEIGGFINQNQGSAIYLNSNLTYRFTANYGLMTEIGLGLGYFHGFHRTDTYSQNEDGRYVEVKDNGIPASSSNISIGLGYDLSRISDRKITPFIRYQWIASTRYWSLLGIRPNGLLHLGIRINFK